VALGEVTLALALCAAAGAPTRAAERPVKRIELSAGKVLAVAISPDEAWLAAGCEQGQVVLVDVAKGAVARRIEAHRGPVRAVAFAPRDGRLASGGEDRAVALWNPATGESLGGFPASDPVRAVAFSSDGSEIVVGTGTILGSGRARLWSGSSSHTKLTDLGTYRESVRAVAVAKSSDLVAVTSDTIDYYEGAPTSRSRDSLGSFSAHALAVAFSPDGRSLASAHDGGAVKLWKAPAGFFTNLLRIFDGRHDGKVVGVAFSPDGRTVASAGQDGVLKLWEAASGRLVEDVRSPCGELTSAAFGSRGALAAGCADGSVLLRAAQP
jgi:WD40 repeat protein